ncbi:hypothetical protein F4805DRAFT_427558 [Annulohypoxylon moriforme]|nr:hypothetical protein F4805DRAFT_427558 [Annulohypoxylon moriforme]
MGLSKEIHDVPTCANCVVECEIDSAEHLEQNALRKVDRVDGGLARKRWERKDGQISRRAVGEIKRTPGVRFKAAIQSPPDPHRSLKSTHGRTHFPRLPGDGAFSGSSDSANEGECIVPLDSTIYVSILDPIGEPAFKPSPTKPIPRWMQWLPSQRNRHRRNEPPPHSLLDEYFPPNPIPEADDSTSKQSSICPISPTEDLPFSTAPTRRNLPQTPDFGNLAHSTIKTVKGPSFVLDEPLMRPSSRMTHSTSHSTSNSSKSTKGDPFPSPSSSYPSDSLPPRTHSPYAPRRPSPLATHEEMPETSEIDKSWKARLRRSPSPLADHVAEHLRRYIRRTPPAQSREFINLYRPLQPPNPGVAVPGRKMEREVGDGRPIRRMLGRYRTPSPRTEGEVRGKSGSGSGDRGPEQVVIGTGDVVDVRSVRKRSSLQSEIKKLLGGRGQGQGKERE